MQCTGEEEKLGVWDVMTLSTKTRDDWGQNYLSPSNSFASKDREDNVRMTY
mgnify:CR=1